MLLYGQPRWGAGRRLREATANGHSHICAARAWRLVRGLDSYPGIYDGGQGRYDWKRTCECGWWGRRLWSCGLVQDAQNNQKNGGASAEGSSRQPRGPRPLDHPGPIRARLATWSAQADASGSIDMAAWQQQERCVRWCVGSSTKWQGPGGYPRSRWQSGADYKARWHPEAGRGLGAAGKAVDTALFDGLSKVNVTDKPAAPKHLLPAPTHSSDPRTILTIKASAGKAVHINTFLTEKTKKRINARKRGVVLGTTEDDNIVLPTYHRHPYTGITHSEWSAANCCLMAFLLRSGELPLSDVEYYLAYTTMIHQYYEVYEWDSILEFDYLYRERICEHGFQWGFIHANMELGLLANPRRPWQGTANAGQGFRAAGAQPCRPAGPPKAKALGEECRLYKNFNGNCLYGDACIFVHPALPKTSPQ